MARTVTVAITIVLVIGLVSMSSFAAAANEETQESDDLSPGEQLAGVVEVQDAELEGDLDERAFGIAVATAANDSAKADVVGDQLTDVEDRLDELDQRRADLDEKREAGEISQGRYAAETARLATEVDTAERLLNASEQEADGLPSDLLDDRGVNVSAIEMLQDRANELSGPEVADIARSITGTSSDASAGPDQTGPPTDELNKTDANNATNESDDEPTDTHDSTDESNDERTNTRDDTDESNEHNDRDEDRGR